MQTAPSKKCSVPSTVYNLIPKRGRPRGRPLLTIGLQNSSKRSRMTTIQSVSSETDASAPSAQRPAILRSRNSRYRLRKRNNPGSRCGTCGLRDCTCILQINAHWKSEPRGVNLTRHNSPCLVSRLVSRAKNFYNGLEREANSPVDYILTELCRSDIAEALYPRFKDGTNDHKGLIPLLQRQYHL